MIQNRVRVGRKPVAQCVRFWHGCDMTNHLEPATTVIKKLGGVEATAAIVGVDCSRVRRWRLPRESGGTNGLIPARHHEALLSWARKHHKGLSYKDFFAKPAAPAKREIRVA